jgi:hypothetical protein
VIGALQANRVARLSRGSFRGGSGWLATHLPVEPGRSGGERDS